MKKLIIGMLLLSLTACATTGTKTDPNITIGNSLLATKQTILNIHEAFRTPCKSGLVAATDCKNVDAMTLQAEPMYDALVDALVLNIQTGTVSADSQAKQKALETLAGDMVALTIKYSIKTQEVK